MPSDKRYPPEKLVSYDLAWVNRYQQLANALTHALGVEWSIEHVGSTSVPGLVAKPVIDLALRTPQREDLHRWAPVFHALGWSDPVWTGDHHALFLLDGGVRTAIAHVFTAKQWAQAHLRLFADWLRTHPVEREEYARLKSHLVEHGFWGTAYTDAKTSFVQGVVNRARAARGLAPIVL